MQQTETLKLNLIETGDPISPAPINENADKIEAAIQAEAAARAALEQRVQVFEAKKFVYGTCSATSEGCTVELGFTPIAVLIHHLKGTDGSTALAVAGQPDAGGMSITENGFTFTVGAGYNIRAGYYTYVALG